MWNSFEDNKSIKKMTSNTIEEFVKRWIFFKDHKEQKWYKKYYQDFYTLKYIAFMNRVNEYKKERSSGRISPFYEWFLTYYLPNEIFP